MFNKILIANRGEIASRIIRTCKRLNIRTVAIYSEADSHAPYVHLADEAYLVGPAPVTESYLNQDRILEIAKDSAAEAIHPGYGFLSENTAFARRCEEEDMVFVGPPVHVIARMGNKIEARRAMEAAGIPVIPGISRPITDVDAGIEAAEKLGFPVMLKASAGGGGSGIEIVHSAEDFAQAFDRLQRRAANYFGNSAMYVEKWIERARHVEIQLLTDDKGRSVHLWERDCSIQRRHQKVVEEAPAPLLDEHTRRNMGEAAIKAAQSIGYRNAGTIEFLVDAEQRFYFLEMNTRLQVEHPVTEVITGLDIVEWQLRLAAGELLTLNQDDIRREGHAIEVRLYAEDPETFLPSPGTITTLRVPRGEHFRHELGVAEQTNVTPHYDPMIGKLIVKGQTRQEAIRLLRNALKAYKIEGIKTNLPLLRKIAAHPSFAKGDINTQFIPKQLGKGVDVP